MPCIYNPHVGGKKIPAQVRLRTDQRIQAYAQRNYAGRFTRIEVRFGAFLVLRLALLELEEPRRGDVAPQNVPRDTRTVPCSAARTSAVLSDCGFFGGQHRWTDAFIHERAGSAPCMFDTGADHGTPEEALDVASVYLPETRPSKRAKPSEWHVHGGLRPQLHHEDGREHRPPGASHQDVVVVRPIEHTQLYELHQEVSPGMDEAFAILRALEIALERGYCRVRIRSDYNQERRLLRQRHRSQATAPDPVRARILELARRLTWVDFRYVPRRRNQLAHRLARAACATEQKASYGSAHRFRVGHYVPRTGSEVQDSIFEAGAFLEEDVDMDEDDELEIAF